MLFRLASGIKFSMLYDENDDGVEYESTIWFQLQSPSTQPKLERKVSEMIGDMLLVIFS